MKGCLRRPRLGIVRWVLRQRFYLDVTYLIIALARDIPPLHRLAAEASFVGASPAQ
jgi:hypothetical protein